MDDFQHSRIPITTESSTLGTSTSSIILNTILSGIPKGQTPKDYDIYSDKTQTTAGIIYDKIFPSNHPFLFPKSQNTPLTAKESDLVTVNNNYYAADGGIMLGRHNSDVTSLAWIIPTVIGIVAAMVILGLLCFFGVRALELKMLRWCQTHCKCCCDDGEETDVLTSSGPINQTEMINYRSASNPDRDEW